MNDLIKIHWNDEVAKALLSAANGDLAEIKDEVINGTADLWECRMVAGESLYVFCGYVVTRVEVRADATTLVIVCAHGNHGRDVLSDFVAIADHNHYAMRIHSVRPGMSRYLKQFNFVHSDTIFKRDIF